MKKVNQNILFIIAVVVSGLFFMGCDTGGLVPRATWSDTSIIKSNQGGYVIFTGRCNTGCNNISISTDVSYERLSCSESGLIEMTFYTKPGSNNAYLTCIGSGIAGPNTAEFVLSVPIIYSQGVSPSSSSSAPIPMSTDDNQTLTVKLPEQASNTTGVLFKLNESDSALKFVDNKNTCQIAPDTDSCSVNVIADSTSVNTQVVTAVIAGYAPETTYISIAPTSISVIPTSSSASPLAIESGEEQTLTVKLPKAKTGTTTATFNITGSNPVIKFANDVNTCEITSPSESCSVSVIGESASATIQNVTAIVDGYNPESAYIRVDKNEKYIFVSDLAVAGNLGGLSGADNICNSDQMLDTHPMLQGHTYKALLNGNSAAKVGKPYFNISNQLIKVATSVNLANDGERLDNPIGVGLNGIYVWTGFARFPDTAASNCNTWSSNGNSATGTAGYASVDSAGWRVTSPPNGTQNCDSDNRLYCVQQ